MQGTLDVLGDILDSLFITFWFLSGVNYKKGDIGKQVSSLCLIKGHNSMSLFPFSRIGELSFGINVLGFWTSDYMHNIQAQAFNKLNSTGRNWKC